jgi:hypothetical protein
VLAVSQGAYSDGMVISAGTAIETIIKNMLQVVVPPNYAAPTLALGSNIAITEIGTTVSPTLTPTWTQNDAGTATAYTLKRGGSGGTTIYSAASPAAYTDSSAYQLTTATQYYARTDYGQGPLKQDNTGADFPTGRIAAGFKEATATLTPRRRVFYWADTSTDIPTTRAQFIAAHATPVFFIASGLEIAIPQGAKRVVIAVPQSAGLTLNTNSIFYVQLNGFVGDTFTLLNPAPLIGGASDYSPIAYTVYYYITGSGFGSAATYRLLFTVNAT